VRSVEDEAVLAGTPASEATASSLTCSPFINPATRMRL